MAEAPDTGPRSADEPHGLGTPWSGAGEAGRIGNPSHSEAGLARYELLQEVGQGGIGVVFRARDRLLGRELAVKVLREDYRDRPDARRRFTEEARVGSRLQHPAIVPVYELSAFDDCRPYLTMKLVEGHTLAALLRDRRNVGQGSDPVGDRQDRNPVPQADLPRLLGVFEQVCQAMA
jgi:serine/threonine-protein kinase